MKKVLSVIISVVSVIYASAQDVDTLNVRPVVITVDSLSLKLEQLQHNYDFLSCDYELKLLQMQLENLSQNINIKTTEVIMDVYNNRYDREFYKLLLDHYDGSCDLFDAMKDNSESVKNKVMLKMIVSNFSDEELNVLYSSFASINKSIVVVESALSYYDSAIKAYKGKRR